MAERCGGVSENHGRCGDVSEDQGWCGDVSENQGNGQRSEKVRKCLCAKIREGAELVGKYQRRCGDVNAQRSVKCDQQD